MGSRNQTISGRERLLTTLEHRQPDRVPYDLNGMQCTGIHVRAYRNLCEYLGLDPHPIRFADIYQQIVIPKAELLHTLGVDVRGLYPLCSHNWDVRGTDRGDYLEHLDEWGFTQHYPREKGHWWSQVGFPLNGPSIELADISAHPWPVPDDARRIAGLRELARQFHSAGYAVMVKGFCAGLFEMGQRLRGMENFLCDLLLDPAKAGILLDKILELKVRFWTMALDHLGDVVDIVAETDDYGTQESQLISYDTYSHIIAPRLRELMRFLKTTLAQKKKDGEKGYVFFHSCGNVRPFLPDFIDMGIDIINPVHISAAGMDPVGLKKDFGRDITFWGGGVDTQNILPGGRPDQVKENVKRNLEVFMPEGGYVFTTVHNIPAEVPPENIVAMWETLQEHGMYS